VLRGSGSALRKQLAKTGTASEQKIMATTLRDMNLAKFIAQDVPLFLSLIDDIFPKVSRALEAADWRELEVEIVKYLKDMNLAGKEVEPGKANPWYTKVIQLHEQSMVRHGFMLVGSVGSGKTTIMKTLVHARTQLKNDLMTGDGQKTYKTIRMNPKAITAEEMYGVVNPMSNEWQSGVFAEIWKRANAKSSKNH
jgi:dynein heavy chain